MFRIACVRMFLLIALAPGLINAEERTLFQFDGPDAGQGWQPVNDGVMGGRSVGRLKINNANKLEFFGMLSLANNGGFASVRVLGRDLGLKQGDVIVARVRGDGRTYNFNLYDSNGFGGYSYRQPFETKKDEWIDVRLRVNRFVATFRGRVFPNQKLDPKKASGLGILLGDKKQGSFKLEVESINVISSQAD